MFLDGIGSLDICSITGHQSVKMLSKYIKIYVKSAVLLVLELFKMRQINNKTDIIDL